MKKILKIIFKTLLVITILISIFILSNYLIHKIKFKNEYNALKKIGYINKYSAGDYNLNVYRVGNKSSKHKIIALSGLGVNDYSVEMSLLMIF